MSDKKKRKTTSKSTRSKKRAQPTTPVETRGWVLLLAAFISLASVLSFAYGEGAQHGLGMFGYAIGWMLTALFGVSCYLLIFYVGWVGWRRLFNKSINHPNLKHMTVALLVISTSMLLTVFEDLSPEFRESMGNFFFPQLWYRKLHFHLGGAPFYYIYKDLPLLNLNSVVNTIGVGVIFGTLFFASLLLLTKTSPATILGAVSRGYSHLKELMGGLFRRETPSPLNEEDGERYVKLRIPSFSSNQQPTKPTKANDPELLAIQPKRNLTLRPSLSDKRKGDGGKQEESRPFEGLSGKAKRREILEAQLPTTGTQPSRRANALAAQRVHNGDFAEYKLPSTSLLTNPKKLDQSSLKKDLRRQAEVLEETLLSFGIEAKVGQINCGPTITSFEVHPAIGVKVQKIKSLQSDIALNMEARTIRILAPIPGKAAIGIEVPNPQPQEVAFKDMLNTYLQGSKKMHIPFIVGKTVNGDYLMEDLTKMPHLIIAGATGSGKSVCINTFVMSLLMTAKPDEIKLIMVDPKKVELTPFTKLPHMLAPVITEPVGACAALSWLVKEMETRYDILKAVGLRNIAAFNSRTINHDIEEELEREIPVKMPYIVCIIDELADLMMVASNDIENYLARIAQMARAVGIHLILATQRPSREVITGLIKANFPTRISFKVSSRINSQIILDDSGAETLLGNGDLLFLPPGAHHLVRAQGAYIRDEDITAVVENITQQAPTNYAIRSFDEMEGALNSSTSSAGGPRDALFLQAQEVVETTGNASTTFLQRKLKVGYARAASIIDQLEAEGIIGPPEGTKPRKVLSKQESDI